MDLNKHLPIVSISWATKEKKNKEEEKEEEEGKGEKEEERKRNVLGTHGTAKILLII